MLNLADGTFAYPDGTAAGRVVPQARSGIGTLRRALAHRPHEARLDVVVYGASGQPVFTVVKHRSSRTRVDVQWSGGGPLGWVAKSKGLVHKTYQVKDAWGRVVGELRSQKPTRAEPHYWALLYAPDGTAVGRITHRMQVRPGAVLAGLARNHRMWWELDLGPGADEPLRALSVGFVSVIGAVTGLDTRPPGAADITGQILPG